MLVLLLVHHHGDEPKPNVQVSVVAVGHCGGVGGGGNGDGGRQTPKSGKGARNSTARRG
uniref:Uncharacterized protein n=1 Tax=Arundo donax TaxID=35708 RepID=A0A0A9B0C8_ARUDO